MVAAVLALAQDGCACWRAAAAAELVRELHAVCPDEVVAGRRLAMDDVLVVMAMPAMQAIAETCRPGARPVRTVLFDKSPTCNWSVPWHQDRTIAVKTRADVADFGPWSIKDGIHHVEPPFMLLAEMVTLRLHLDPCPAENSPLEVALGTHRQRVAAGDALSAANVCVQELCTADAGDVWVYATPILHRSGSAAAPVRRRVLQIDFSAATLPVGLEWRR